MAAVLLYVCSAFVVWTVLWRCHIVASDHLLCPSSCTCLGNMVDCSKKGLITVPKDLPIWVTILDLQSNGITTLDADDFIGLHKLQTLDLSNNDITFINGSVFDDLNALQKLNLQHNKLREMPVPSHPLSNVTELTLSHNKILTLSAEALKAFPVLEVLHLDHNEIMDIPAGAFPPGSQLIRLYLNNNEISRLESGSLDNLGSLKLLKLNKNKMFELKKKIFTSLSNLKFLELSRNKISTIQGLTFEGLQNLQVLKLKRNVITTLMDGAFFGLGSINNLQLDFNNISNVTKGWLYGLTTLKHLSLSYNKIIMIQQDGLKFCKDLDILDLTYNQLSAIFPGTFARLSSLEYLLLDHNKVSRIDDGAFKDLRSLSTLQINDNAISWTMEDVSGAFVGLKNLVKLGLKMNHIKSITNQAFDGLDNLRHLYLEDNEITTIQENSFQPLQDLQELRLNSTNLLCDCHISWLPRWLGKYAFQNTVTAVCGYPAALRGKSIFDVPVSDFKCSEQEIPKPIILKNPISQNAFKGENVTLTCSAAISGDVQPTILWKKDNTMLSSGLVETFAESDGEVKRYTSNLHLHNVQDDMAGRYQCVISSDFGSAFSQRAKITFFVFPVFNTKPVDITVKAGQSAKLQCSATGQPQPVISWRKDGGDDFPAARERRMRVIPDDDQFFIVGTRNTDEGVYTCVARNEAGVISTNATVTILETPDFIRPMEDQKTSRTGETSVLECMASGSPRPKLRWLKDSQPLEVTPRHFFTADNQLLIIVETKWEDAGVYTCEMSNTLGIMRGMTHLRVVSPDGQVNGKGGNSGGLDDESTTTGIIIIAVVCCVVGTSLVWVIIIYQTRKRHEMYSATPTGWCHDETTLPGEVPSSGGYSSSDKEGSYTQGGTVGLAAYQYQDYQLKESGYESSSGQYHANGWAGGRPTAAIFPSDVDEVQVEQMSLNRQQLKRHHRGTSVSSLPYVNSEESDTVDSSHSSRSASSDADRPRLPRILPSQLDTGTSAMPLDAGLQPLQLDTGLLPLTHGGSNSAHGLSTFYSGPTNHNRCSRLITLPTVCGENVGSTTLPTVCGENVGSTTLTVAATTQTPSSGDPSSEGDSGEDCERCRLYTPQRHLMASASNSDFNASLLSPSSLPPCNAPPTASSFSSLSAGGLSSRVTATGSGGSCCCESGSCARHKNGSLGFRKQQHAQIDGCGCSCEEVCQIASPSATTCSHHVCRCGSKECRSWKQDRVPSHYINGISGSSACRTACCAQCIGIDSVDSRCASSSTNPHPHRDYGDGGSLSHHLHHMHPSVMHNNNGPLTGKMLIHSHHDGRRRRKDLPVNA